MTPTLNQRRARGQLGTAALLAGLERSSHLRRHAERVAPAPDSRRLDPVAAAAELRRAIVAVRVLNARRELLLCLAALREEPDPTGQGPVLRRVAQITAWLGDLARSGAMPSLPWEAILERERDLPARRPRRSR